MGKENYVSIEVAKLLKEKEYDWVSDSMYRNNYRLKDDIKDKYPWLSDDGYLDLLKKNGGELEEDEVYGYYEDPVIITCKNDKLYFDCTLEWYAQGQVYTKHKNGCVKNTTYT